MPGSYYGQLMDAHLALQGLGPDGKPLMGGDPDMHGGHADLPPAPPAAPAPDAAPAPAPAPPQEAGYPLP